MTKPSASISFIGNSEWFRQELMPPILSRNSRNVWIDAPDLPSYILAHSATPAKGEYHIVLIGMDPKITMEGNRLVRVMLDNDESRKTIYLFFIGGIQTIVVYRTRGGLRLYWPQRMACIDIFSLISYYWPRGINILTIQGAEPRVSRLSGIEVWNRLGITEQALAVMLSSYKSGKEIMSNLGLDTSQYVGLKEKLSKDFKVNDRSDMRKLLFNNCLVEPSEATDYYFSPPEPDEPPLPPKLPLTDITMQAPNSNTQEQPIPLDSAAIINPKTRYHTPISRADTRELKIKDASSALTACRFMLSIGILNKLEKARINKLSKDRRLTLRTLKEEPPDPHSSG